MRIKSVARWLLLFALPLAMVAGCALAQADSAAPEPSLGEETYDRLAIVEEVSILILESWPVQINVEARGYLHDAVTVLDIVEIRRDGHRIGIRIYTTRDPEAMGAQVLTPFALTIPLDYAELEPGAYTVDVNGVQETLVIDEGMLGE